MKNIVYYVIVPIFVLLLGVYIQKDKVEVNYFLSEKIPFSLDEEEESENSIQVLEIRNIGDKKATEINVKINKQVLDYQIVKNAKSDEEKLFNENNSFEMDYDGLPVDGIFKLTIVTKGNGITQNDIEISHSEGKAKNALEEKGFSISQITAYSIILFYSLLILKIFLVDSLEFKASYKGQNQILKKSKPSYITGKRWNNIRKIAINSYFDHDYLSIGDTIENNPYYNFLNSERPSYITVDEFNTLINKATKKLTVELEGKFYNSLSELMNLLKKEKPKHFIPEIWEKIKTANIKTYLTVQKTKFNQMKISELKEFELNKPTELPQESWEEISEYYYNIYFRELLNLITRSDSPWALYNEYDTSKFPVYHKSSLKEIAITLEISKLENLFEVTGATNFLSNESSRESYGYNSYYSTFKEIAQKTIDHDKKIEEYNILLKTIKDVSDGNGLPIEKPISINERNWINLERINSKIKYYLDNEKELRTIETNLKPLIQKIEKQLDIINNALNDETALSRVEEYSNAFEKGNFDNLKKIIEAHYRLKNE